MSISDPGAGERPGAGNDHGGSRRRRNPTPRSRQVSVRLSEDEYYDLAAAAQRAELTTTGFVAEAALAVARGQAAPSEPVAGITRAELKLLQRELLTARAALGRVGSNLNQAVKVLKALGRPAAGLDEAAAHCVMSMRNLDAVVAEVDRRLR